jgi:hypothetical protein
MTRLWLPIVLVLVALAQQSSAPLVRDADSDGDGLSDYAEVHKYFTDPSSAHSANSTKPDGDWEQRKEFTYTITSVMQFARPFDLADMSDDYQDARLVSQDGDSITVEVVYYPLNTNKFGIGENPNWRADYAGMQQYLRPTPTENWDEKMRADLIAALQKDGIDPERLTDRELVSEVSHWLMKRSRYTNAFAIWDVHYPNGVPEVFPALRAHFDHEKPSTDVTDQAMFDQEVLGRSMFYNKVHGSCTSSAVYMATVLRALGIPTRIVFCVPPFDGNDRKQREMFLSAIHHNRVRSMVRHGAPSDNGGSGNFANHLFNEVFIGKRWVRLNYDVLGQNNLDDSYFGLLTHILTTDSLSHVAIAETWGLRDATYPDAGPKLSSINPYRLLRVSDHFGVKAHIANPEIDDEELRKVTVTEAYWKGAVPSKVWQDGFHGKDPVNSDFYIGIQEFIPHFQLQMREFAKQAGNHFVLTAPGHPDINATTSGMKLSYGEPNGGRHYSLFGLKIDAESRDLLESGAAYSIRPVNTSETYVWTMRDGLTVNVPAK